MMHYLLLCGLLHAANAARFFEANPAACVPKGLQELSPEPNGTGRSFTVSQRVLPQ